MSPDTPNNGGRLWLGIDAGSISLDAVLLDDDETVVASQVVVTSGRTTDSLVNALKDLASEHPQAMIAGICITGSGRNMLAQLLDGASTVNEITAHALGTGPLLPGRTTCSLLEIGGQDSKLLALERTGKLVEVHDYAMNTLCAAGTGTFFDGQAERLGLTIDEFASMAAKAPRAASVAGRCVVFAKTDIIHHQQKGTPIEELALGLCHTAARNIIGTLIRGRPVHNPLYFTGGVAANPGMVRALREVLDLSGSMPVVPDDHRVLGAVGAAMRAHQKTSKVTRVTPLVDLARKIKPPTPSLNTDEPALSTRSTEEPAQPASRSASRVIGAPPERGDTMDSVVHIETPGIFAGFDLGSVSVKWVLLEGDRVLDSYYAFTEGKPVVALAEALDALKASTSRRIEAIGVTGSGRKLASRLLEADVTINEITAHATAMRMLDPEVDTLFEIGGQDAKYVRLDGDSIEDFALNTACSAGTGSLLLEESVRLGLSVSELDDTAERSDNPQQLHDRCTVFIDSDLVSRMQGGTPIEDLAAGLMSAVARNYIERVVAGRKPGEHIVFAGGVSRSRFVTRELSRLTDREVIASPWGAHSGAIGAAIIAARSTEDTPSEALRKAGDSPPVSKGPAKGHDPASLSIPLTPRSTRTIRCHGCGASCAVTRLEFDSHRSNDEPAKPASRSAKGKDVIRLFTGDACGRWSERTDSGPDPDSPRITDVEDLFEIRSRLHGLEHAAPPLAAGQIGVPRAQQMWDHYPLISTLMGELGLTTGLSAPTKASSIHKGIALSSSEQCMPIKVALAHCDDLLDREPTALLVPSLGEYPYDETLDKSEMDRLLNCIYTIQLGSVVRATLGERAKRKGVPILVPSISMNPDLFGYSVSSIAKALSPLGSFSKRKVKNAFTAALEVHHAHRKRSESLGIQALNDATADHPAVVIFGRPYTLYDPVLNIQLAERLRRLGVTPIPYDTILSAGHVPEHLSFMQWKAGSDHLKAATALQSIPHAHPLYLTYYGCGPDAFVGKYFDEILGKRPSLCLELDGHSAEAGLETRLEAFVDSIHGPRRLAEASAKADIRLARNPGLMKGRVVALSDFHDLAHAFAGAFERAGMEARIMPASSDETRLLGERYSDGRECNPYTIMLGDVVRWAMNPSVPNSRKGYFITSARGPCLITHYATSFARVLNEIGAGDLLIWNPTGKELEEVLTLEESITLWHGIVTCNYLHRWGVALHPYEKIPGSIDSAKTEALTLIRRGMRDAKLFPRISEAVEIMRGIPSTRYEPGERDKRIKVGIVGDLYTRANPFANQNLYETLESLGCEVFAPPFVLDGQLYDAWDHPIQHFTHGRLSSALKRSALSAFQFEELWRIRRLFPDDPEITFDGSGLDWRKRTTKYFNSDVDGYLTQNLGKALEFIDIGAEGILNVMCHNCMVGLASDAVISDIRKDHGDIPYLSLAYDSLGDVHVCTRLEAFVDLIRARRDHPQP